MINETRSLEEKEEMAFEMMTGYKAENGVFYKSADERTSPERFGDEYSDIEEEYEALQRLHSIAPSLWTKPLMKTYDEEGNVDGYFMEEAPGFELNDFTQTYPSHAEQDRTDEDINTEFVRTQIQYLDNIMNMYGEAHGDLTPWNIKIDPETSRITGYDPVGFDRDTAGTEKARKKDRDQIDKIISDLESAS